MKIQLLGFTLASLLIVAGCKDGPSAAPAAPSAPSGEAAIIEPGSTIKPVNQDHMPFEVETLAEGLDAPWDLAFLPDGALYVTERSGNIRAIRDGKVREKPVFTAPPPFRSGGEGGLLGLALDPEYNRNSYLYVYHTYEEKGTIANRVLRLKGNGEEAVLDKVLLSGIPGDRNHNGGRIRFGPDGYLYITAGDRYEPALAQDPLSLGGKVLRIDRDGNAPPGNLAEGSFVYSMGHRNPQGLAWHPITGKLYSTEHGQTAQDEVNLIEPGGNYGWPDIRGSQSAPRFRNPLIHSGEDTWAPSGLAIPSQGPWKGKLAAAALRGERLLIFELDAEGKSIMAAESFAFKQWGRLRSVTEGPDGHLYVLTNNRDGRGNPRSGDDRILKLIPKN